MRASLLLILLVLACGSRTDVSAPDPSAPGETPQTQTETGTIAGVITLREGNCQPIIDPNRCKTSHPSRTVWLYPVQLAVQDGKKRKVPETIDAKPVAQGMSDSNGAFRIAAPVGRWSFFVEDSGHPYACCFDAKTGEIDVVAIAANVETSHSITIDKATH